MGKRNKNKFNKRTQFKDKKTLNSKTNKQIHPMDSTSNIKTEPTYKDRLFRMLFGFERYKENLLELYNALNHCHYTNADELEITTIENVIYIGMKNDTSFLLHGHMALYEHQFTYNPNMPLRGLLYIGKLYQKYIEQRNYNIYGSKLIKIPAPQYVVFYNGDKELPDRTILKLSEAFEKPVAEGQFEWTATLLNINYGKNQELMAHCQVLKEYAQFIDKCKTYVKIHTSTSEAITTAVNACIKENILKNFLITHRGEVLEVLLTEFDKEKYEKAIKKEAWEDGHETGLLKGHEAGLREGHKAGLLEGQATERQKNITSTIQMFINHGLTPEDAILEISKNFDLNIEYVKKIWEKA